MDKVKAVLKRIAGDRSTQRAFWTVVEVSCGAVAAAFSGSTEVGAVVIFLCVAVKELAVRNLAKRDVVAAR